MPDEEIEYEARYLLANPDGSTRVVGRSVPFTPQRTSVSLGGPAKAVGGSQIEVKWTGPNNPGDYVTIVKKGDPVGTYTQYFYTKGGNPGSLSLPDQPGQYELRYSSEQASPNPTLYSLPFTVK